jgi:hypothetical protein
MIGLFVNAETGEVVERQFTEQEIAQHEQDLAARLQAEAQAEAEAAEKAARRAEILERLGLTEDEAKLILG